MNKILNKNCFGLLLIFSVVGIFFFRTIISGSLPIPSDSLVGLYHPWRDYYAKDYPRGVPFKNFLTTDPIRQQIPWRKSVITEIKNGHMPLWNPYLFSGTPLAANIQSGAYYPFNILFFFLDFPYAWTGIIILEMIFNIVFLFWYLRNRQISVLGSFFGSTIWGLSGFSIAWFTWGTIGHVACWLPLALLSIDKITESKTTIKQLFWTIVFLLTQAIHLTAGHAQISLYIYFFVFIYGLFRIYGSKNRIKIASFLSLGLLFSCLSTYFVWKPMIGTILESTRSVGEMYTREGWFFPWKHFAQFFAPDYFGNPTTLNYTGVWNYGELVGYVGVIGLLFALYAMVTKKTRVEKLFLSCLFISFVFMTANPLTIAVFCSHIPVIASLQPTRLIFLVDFSLAILAAFGFDKFMGEKNKKALIITQSSMGFAFLVLWIVGYITKSDVAIRNLVLPSIVLCILIITSWISFLQKKQIVLVATGAVFCIFSIADLTRFGWKFIPFTEKTQFFPQTPTISFLLKQTGIFRIMPVDDRIFAPNTFEYYGLESVSGYDPLFNNKYGTYVASVSDKKSATGQRYERMISPSTLTDGFLSSLNVRYILSLNPISDDRFSLVFTEGETKIYEYTGWVPRIWFPDTWKKVDSENAVLNEVIQPAFSPTRCSYVSQSIPEKGNNERSADSVTITSYTFGELEAKTDTIASERLLVFSTPPYTGWKAYIDGVEVPILPVNYIQMGIMVSQGKHTISFMYRGL